jgi:Acyl-CoA thioester hydrolase/BAAT N-terminal region
VLESPVRPPQPEHHSSAPATAIQNATVSSATVSRPEDRQRGGNCDRRAPPGVELTPDTGSLTVMASTSFSLLFLLATLTFPVRSQPPVDSVAARFKLAHDDVLLDEPIPILVSGLTPGASVTIRLRGGLDAAWSANTTFTADRDGRIAALHRRRHPLTGRFVHAGGTPAGTAKARENSWRQMLVFVDRHLRDLTPDGF